jgi:hypothetical protein
VNRNHALALAAAAFAPLVLPGAPAADATYIYQSAGTWFLPNNTDACASSYSVEGVYGASSPYAWARTFYNQTWVNNHNGVGDWSCDDSEARIYYNNGYRTTTWNGGGYSDSSATNDTAVTSIQGSGHWFKVNGYPSGESRLYN